VLVSEVKKWERGEPTKVGSVPGLAKQTHCKRVGGSSKNLKKMNGSTEIRGQVVGSNKTVYAREL